MDWIRTSQILCLFGFLKEFRPNEPFIYQYLTGPWKNFTSDTVIQEIYPVATYSNFATLILVFLLTDLLRYKPVIILCGISGVLTFTILIFGNTVATTQAVEFFYGLYISTEVAYYTYIYAKVDKEHYQEVSSYTRSALLFGRFITGIVGQLLTTFELLDFHQLNYLTLLGQILAVIGSLFIPSVKISVYFHRCDDKSDYTQDIKNKSESGPVALSDDVRKNNTYSIKNIKRAYHLLWQDFIRAYTNYEILKWSLWWAAASCGYLQILTYSQSIWITCVENDDKLYNGIVESLYTVISAVTVYGVGKLHLNWTVFGELVLSLFSFAEALFLLFISTSYNIWIQYILYIAFGVIYHTIVTVCSFQVAKRISDDSFGLIFGINIFLALTLQSILTFTVTSGNVFVLDIRVQFAIFSGYFAFLGAIFMIIAIFTIYNYCIT